LGLEDEMVKVYQRATLDGRGPLAAEMSFAVAEANFGAGKWASARKVYRALAAQAGPWSGRSQLRLAEIALHENEPRTCLRWCRKVPKAQPGPDPSVVLKVMGKAYEVLGDHQQAARCYAGQVPPE
jgi:hypothetical protein